MEINKKIITVLLLCICFSFSVSALNLSIDVNEFQLRVEKCNGELVGIYYNESIELGYNDYILILQERETNLTYMEMVSYPVEILNTYKKPLTIFTIILMMLILIIIFYSLYIYLTK